MPLSVDFANFEDRVGRSIFEKFEGSSLGKTNNPTTDTTALESDPALPATIVSLLKAIAISVNGIEPLIQNVNVTASSINLNTDTLEAKIGDLNSTPPSADTDAASLNSRLIRLAQLLSSLSAKLPSALGVQTVANSLSVTLASDQSALPVAQGGTWDVRNVTGTVSLPTGASTETTLSALNTKIPNIGQATLSASIPVAIASNQSALSVTQSGTWDLRNITGSISLPTGASTLGEQQTQTGILQLLDDPVGGNNAAFNKAFAISGQYNDTSVVTPNEGNTAAARITQQRGLHVNLRNSTGTELGTLTAPIQVSLAATASNSTPVNVSVSSLPNGLATDSVLQSVRDRLNPQTSVSADGTLASINTDWTATDPTAQTSGNATNPHSVPVLLRWLVRGLQSIGSRLPSLSSGRIPVEILDYATQTTLSALNLKIPSQGQATLSASIPVAIASNQSAVPVSSSTFSTLTEQQSQTTHLSNLANATNAANSSFSRAIAIGAQMDDTSPTVAVENAVSPLRINSQRSLYVRTTDDSGNLLGNAANPFTVAIQNVANLAQDSSLSTLNGKIAGQWLSDRRIGTVASQVVKTSAGNVFAISVHNTSSLDRWFQLFNTASTPSGTPLESHRVPSQGALFLTSNDLGLAGINFSTGIAWGMSTAANTYTAATASETFVVVRYL